MLRALTRMPRATLRNWPLADEEALYVPNGGKVGFPRTAYVDINAKQEMAEKQPELQGPQGSRPSCKPGKLEANDFRAKAAACKRGQDSRHPDNGAQRLDAGVKRRTSTSGSRKPWESQLTVKLVVRALLGLLRCFEMLGQGVGHRGESCILPVLGLHRVILALTMAANCATYQLLPRAELPRHQQHAES